MPECPTCGSFCETKSGVKKHHTHVHGESLTQKTWTCSHCTDEFIRPESQIGDAENTFCSKECHGKWMEEHKSQKISVKCTWCDENFLKTPTEYQERENHFCSHACHGNWKSETGTVDVQCQQCNKTVTKNITYAERTERHFCSSDCQGSWYSENLRGEEHPLWKGGGISYYGPTWYSQRRKALERDNHECQDCGMTREEHYEQYDADLEVHHKTPIRTFEDTADANKLSNLITVCTNCHIKREHSI